MGEGEGPRRRIAICLSGGGFRATLFHLGVVKALRAHLIEGEMALNRVAEVYAVSGGSILAAHMLKNWDLYASADEAEFEQVSDEVLAFAKRDVRNRVLRRAGLTFWSKKSSTQWLQDEYASKRFLGSTTLDASYARSGLPTFHFLATNFNSGELCSFSGANFELTERIDDGTFETHATPAGSIPLAFAVAASSSFPVAFPPITLTPRALGHPESQYFQMPIELSDGGVYDNFGLEKFFTARRASPAPSVLIVSNAGGSFQADPQKSYDALLSRNIRASDVMMRRVGESTLQAGRQMSGDGFTLVRIGGTTSSSQISKTTQQMLRLVRTDLDRFDAPLAGLLVDHGEGVARDAFNAKGWQVTSEFSGQAPVKNRKAAVEAIEQAAKRGNASFFFDIRDWAWLLLWWALFAIMAASITYMALEYRRAKSEEEKLERDRTEQLNNYEVQLEQARVAASSGDLSRIRKVLAVAILETQELGNNPDIATPPAKPLVDDRTVAQIIDGPQTIPSFEKTNYSQRVFIQFAGVLSRAQITGLNSSLVAAGWNAQGGSGERTPKAAGLNEVRFSGANDQAAQALCDAINKSGLLAKRVMPKKLEIIGSNDLEVWISR